MNKPIVAVPTMDAIAYNLYHAEGYICPIIDARRNHVYTGIYAWNGDEFEVVKEQCAESIDEIIEEINLFENPVIFLGDGVAVHREHILETCTVPVSFAPAHLNRQRAGAVGSLGMEYYKRGKIETAAEHRPDYLKKSQAEREWERNMRLDQLESKVQDSWQRWTNIVFGQLKEKDWQQFLSLPQYRCYIVTAEELPKGSYLYQQRRMKGEIIKIGVLPECRRQNFGTSILREAFEKWQDEGIRHLFLEVRESNRPARALYQKLGFEEVGIRKIITGIRRNMRLYTPDISHRRLASFPTGCFRIRMSIMKL